MSDSDFTNRETNKFTEWDYCEDGADCITRLFEPNDFVLLKLAINKSEIIFWADPRNGAWLL